MKVFKVDELVEILRVSRPTVIRLIKKGDIKAVKVGDQYRITEIDFNEYMGVKK